MSIKTWLLQTFTWWSGQTINTRFHTWRHGEFVGTDEVGNAYYRTKGGAIDPALGYERRWVIYAGESEGSATPPGWYGWLHHSTDTPPTAESVCRARLGAAPQAEHDRHAGRLSPAGLDPERGRAPARHRRLQGLDAGRLNAQARHDRIAGRRPA